MQKKEQSFQTKRLLADALKETLKHKPFSKIRIRELTDHCGIYRQTFYYHFTDLESLLLWSAQQDIDNICSGQDGVVSCQERIEHLLQYIAEYRGFFLAVIDGDTYPAQRQALYINITTLLSESLLNDSDHLPLTTEQYATIVSSVLEQWIRGPARQSSDDVARFLTELFGEAYMPHMSSAQKIASMSLLKVGC